MAAPEKQAPREEVELARGRSIRVGEKTLTWREGESNRVRVPAEDVSFLLRAGFIVDPDKLEIPQGEGPTFSEKDGPSVRVA